MRKFLFLFVPFLFYISGCTRIETGEIGVRIGLDKQVKSDELLPGSFNQTVFGDVLIFPVKDVNVSIENMTPVAKDNSTMNDFDVVVVYNINPKSAADIYSTKNKSFHLNEDGETFLMYNYIVQNTRNAVYKATRQYEALDMADNRDKIELQIKEQITKNILDEKMDGDITISQVLVRNITPSTSVVESANALVRAKNEFKQKEIEVQTAKKEAERMAALSANSANSIAFMNAQAALNISEGIKNGKVQTIVVPSNMTGLMINR